VQRTGRSATVVLVQDAQVLGALPPVQLELPWWPEVHEVVAAVREHYGIDVTVLRLLRAVSDRISGGAVTYLAETDSRPDVPLDPFAGDPLPDEPLRQLWARPGGPAQLLGWADDRLAVHDLPRTGRAQQMRSWNLSAIWRIPTGAGPVWFKVVPEFFAHEGAVIDWIGPPVAPALVGGDWGRVLLADVAGADNHDTRGAALRPMVELLTGLQQRSLGRLDELIAVGVPDRRLAGMVQRVAAVVAEQSTALSSAQRGRLDRLVSDLPSRLAAIRACGVPDGLVHGDFHPGNVRSSLDRHVILDWGDSFVGHPLIDELAFTERLPPEDQSTARGWFVTAWKGIVPGSEPERAADLLSPVLPLLAAVMYADFCANIEPDERIYHASDVTRMLRQAARL
jgi:hypothetical protein